MHNHRRLAADTHILTERLEADSQINTTTDFETLLGEPSYDILRKTISGLPLEDLTDIARQLIATEILTKTITCQTPTAGGPIKILTITRAGGWSDSTPCNRAT